MPTTLSPLQRADGSAHHLQNGYQILVGVNGPIEVSRRDEVPEACALEITVRPATGPSKPSDKYLETRIHALLKQVVCTEEYPRTLIQITIQTLQEPSDPKATVAGRVSAALRHSAIPALTAMVNACTVSLMNANIAMNTTVSAYLAMTFANGAPQIFGTEQTAGIWTRLDQNKRRVKGLHVFALDRDCRLIFSEEEGEFSLEDREQAISAAIECEHTGRQSPIEEGVMLIDADDERGIAGRNWLLEVVQN